MLAKTPIYLLTGFLGAGKTHLFQRLSAHTPFDHALVIVNEFGGTSIDDVLMVNENGKAEALAGGCVCCTSRNELVTTIQLALAQDHPPSAIVIETTGLASPQPILKALSGSHQLAALLDLLVITVIDATTAMALLETQQTAQEQLALADAVLLTKTDLMSDESQLAAIAPYLQQLNPLAEVTSSAQQGDGALAHWLANLPLNQELRHSELKVRDAHIGTIQSTVLTLNAPTTPQMLEAFLFESSRRLGPSLLRLKGFVQLEATNDTIWLVQMVQGVVSPPEELENRLDLVNGIQIVAIAESAILVELRMIYDGIFGKGAIDTPDAQALNDNPLSIAGF